MSKLSSGSTTTMTVTMTTTAIIVLVIAVVVSGCTDSTLPVGHPAIDADEGGDGVTTMQNTRADFDVALQSKKPVVVYFNEAICSKCKDQKPIIESINTVVGDQAVVIVLDRKENPELISEYNITIAPNMLIFDGDGNVISTGYVGSEKLASIIGMNVPETNNEINEKMNV